MGHEPETPPADAPDDAQSEAEAPPFDPDPRLVTYLERGARSDAQARFRAEIERSGD